jgi:hypothetical protein
MVRLRPWLSTGLIVAFGAAYPTLADAAPKKAKKPTATAPAPAPTEEAPDIDRQAAATAITETNLQKCKATNATKGDGHVTITFSPAGAAQSAAVDKGPWVGTPVAKCMVKAFKKTKIPAFKGDAVTVGKTFHFE